MDAIKRKQTDKLMTTRIDIIAGNINSYVEGRESGLAEGLEKGREEGLEKGREEGARKTAEKNAWAFLRLGAPAETVAKGTELSLKEIQELAYNRDNR